MDSMSNAYPNLNAWFEQKHRAWHWQRRGHVVYRPPWLACIQFVEAILLNPCLCQRVDIWIDNCYTCFGGIYKSRLLWTWVNNYFWAHSLMVLKMPNRVTKFFAKFDKNLMKCFGILKTRTNEPMKWVCWKFIYQTRGPNPLVFKMPKHTNVFFWSIWHFFFVRWFGILKTREKKGSFEKHITLEWWPRCRFEANLTCHIGNTAVDHLFWRWSHPQKKWI